jgi:hypothetical protein
VKEVVMLHFASKLTALSVRFTDLIDGGGIDSGRRSRLGVLAVGCKVGGAAVEGIETLTDGAELLEDRRENLLGGGGGGVQHLHGHLLDAENVTGESGHLVGMKQQRLLLVAAVFGIELAGVEGRVEIAGIRVGIPIHRSPGTIEGFLYIFDTDQGVIASIGTLFAASNGLAAPERIKDLVRAAGRGWGKRTRRREHETEMGQAGIEM